MSKSKDIILDLETLGVSEDSVILSIGLLILDDEDKERSFEDLYVNNTHVIKLDAAVQAKEYNRKIHKDVLDWWKKQDPQARQILKPSDTDIHPSSLLDQLKKILDKHGYDPKNIGNRFWQRGTIDYDMIASLLRQTGDLEEFHSLMNWGAVRDIRTAIEMANVITYGSTNKYAVPHDDAVAAFTDNEYPNWWEYKKHLEEETDTLIAHDAGSDCILQFHSMKIAGLF